MIDDLARAVVVPADVGEDGAHLLQVRRAPRQQELGGLRIAQDGPERLAQLVRQARRQLGHGGHATDVGQLGAQSQHFGLVLLAGRDVHDGGQDERPVLARNRAQSDFSGELSPVLATGGDLPSEAHGAGARSSEISLPMPGVIAARPFWHQDLDRLARQFLACVAEEPLCLRVDQQHPAFAVHQHDSAWRGFHDSAELFLCLGHLLLAHAQLIREPRGTDHVVAQLVAHRRDQAQVEQARGERRMDDSSQYQHGLERSSEREERDASAHHQRLAPITPAPGRKRGVRDEQDEQQQAQLTDHRPGTAHALANGDGFPEKRKVSQRGDLPVVHVRPRTEKIEQQRQRPQAADREGQPQSPRPQVEPRKRDERHDRHPDRHMRPPQRQAELSRASRPASSSARTRRRPPPPPPTGKRADGPTRCVSRTRRASASPPA